MRELLLGCGHDRRKKVMPRDGNPAWVDVTTLDRNPLAKPDVLWDLERIPWPFDTNLFDEVHAYDVLEHVTGWQGDEKPYFGFFSELWRVMKPDARLYAIVPAWKGQWAWGDPSHKRVINEGTITFLDQGEYIRQIDHGSAMSDYRNIYQADFELVWCKSDQDNFYFILRVVKPSRCNVDLSQ